MAPAPAESALRIRGLRKAYKVGHIRQRSRPALRGLDLDVGRGEVFGYLGPNGSGKTTTLKVIMGLVFPDAGEVQVLGHALTDSRWRYRVGYMPEHPYLYDYLTPREYLDYVGRLFGIPRAERQRRAGALLERVGLSHAADLAMRRFSKGMVQRAGLAQALINEPELVFLDEPMSGLDPVGRRLVRDLIVEMKAAGKTIFFSTHILSDAEALCDRVAVLRGGELLESGRLEDILRVDIEHVEVLASSLPAAAAQALPGVRALHAVSEDRWRLEVVEQGLPDLVRAIAGAGGRVLSVQPMRQSLEEHFFGEIASGPAADVCVVSE
jgi:ABC-2 type transport system ATP-binding protein